MRWYHETIVKKQLSIACFATTLMKRCFHTWTSGVQVQCGAMQYEKHIMHAMFFFTFGLLFGLFKLTRYSSYSIRCTFSNVLIVIVSVKTLVEGGKESWRLNEVYTELRTYLQIITQTHKTKQVNDGT